MGKRSNFPRIEKDFYRTPKDALVPLLPHLLTEKTYWEPCCGDGALVKALEELEPRIKCIGQSDIECDARTSTFYKYMDIDCFITNPPWTREILHPIIENLSNQHPTWLLFDADWMHTRQSSELIKKCISIVSVGRVKWFPETNMTGKDNCCWYLFDGNRNDYYRDTIFYGR